MEDKAKILNGPVHSARKLDVPTQLQILTTNLCGQYSHVLGTLLNEAEADSPTLLTTAQELGQQIVLAHSTMEELINELTKAHRSEEQQLQRIRQLEEEHDRVTEELRTQTEETGASQFTNIESFTHRPAQ